jgi:putative transport protein
MLAMVIVAGLGLGSIKFRGIGLGSAGVLFAGILFGHFGQSINHEILDFTKEFGLILFVFTIGLQLGPGFFSALKSHGLRLNALAAAIVFGGMLVAVVSGKLLGFDFAAVVGLFSGATTNTPSLGAAQQALSTMPSVTGDRSVLPALAYAVAYPGGIVGIISSLLILKSYFGIDTKAEVDEWDADNRKGAETLIRRTLIVSNPNMGGVKVRDIPGRSETAVTISRIRSENETEVRTASGSTELRTGDAILVVGTERMVDRFQKIIGHQADVDLVMAPGPVGYRRVLVTRKKVLGKTLAEARLEERHGVTVTRIARSDIEMNAYGKMRLQFGDLLHLVGKESALNEVEKEVGNSTKALNETQFIPIFLGIALGIVLGLLPIRFPGIPEPVRLGLAGGPLILAILVSRVGNIGPLVWYMPPNANLAFRELGITLFLACVGLKAGEKFFETVFSARGLEWLLVGAAITMIPLLCVGWFARWKLKMNFMNICGLLAGSMTDPPALAFAGNISQSEAPSMAYATVYPLTMLLRILCAQLLVLIFC